MTTNWKSGNVWLVLLAFVERISKKTNIRSSPSLPRFHSLSSEQFQGSFTTSKIANYTTGLVTRIQLYPDRPFHTAFVVKE